MLQIQRSVWERQASIRLLHLAIEFQTVPIMRDKDGLALSSRNRRLTAEQRRFAPAIFQALTYIRDTLIPGDTGPVIETARQILDAAHFKTDYISISNAVDLEPVHVFDGKVKTLALIAAFQGDVRLIDNMLLN